MRAKLKRQVPSVGNLLTTRGLPVFGAAKNVQHEFTVLNALKMIVYLNAGNTRWCSYTLAATLLHPKREYHPVMFNHWVQGGQQDLVFNLVI
jgi:hypothetical protein